MVILNDNDYKIIDLWITNHNSLSSMNLTESQKRQVAIGFIIFKFSVIYSNKFDNVNIYLKVLEKYLKFKKWNIDEKKCMEVFEWFSLKLKNNKELKHQLNVIKVNDYIEYDVIKQCRKFIYRTENNSNPFELHDKRDKEIKKQLNIKLKKQQEKYRKYDCELFFLFSKWLSDKQNFNNKINNENYDEIFAYTIASYIIWLKNKNEEISEIILMLKSDLDENKINSINSIIEWILSEGGRRLHICNLCKRLKNIDISKWVSDELLKYIQTAINNKNKSNQERVYRTGKNEKLSIFLQKKYANLHKQRIERDEFLKDTEHNEQIIKTYKYKLRPTKGQILWIEKMFECRDSCWNWCVRTAEDSYKETGRIPLHFDMDKLYFNYRKESTCPIGSTFERDVCLSAICNLYTTYKQYFLYGCKNKKFSKPKEKTEFSKSSYCRIYRKKEQIKIDFENWKINLPNIKWMEICKSRIIKEDIYRIESVSFKKECGEYWVSLKVLTAREKGLKIFLDQRKAIGIDMGIRHFATFSNGEQIDLPENLKELDKKKRYLQRQLSKHTKGSYRYRSILKKLEKVELKIKNVRSDFHKKIAKGIVDQYDIVSMETLGIEEMKRDSSRQLNFNLSNAGWYEFRETVKWKCKERGKQFIGLDTYFPSSQICSYCGERSELVKDGREEWICPKCGKQHNRDVNAAINIKNEAFKNFGIELRYLGSVDNERERGVTSSRKHGADVKYQRNETLTCNKQLSLFSDDDFK